LAYPNFAQVAKGKLLDEENNPIAYAHIYNIKTEQGTLTNADGIFKVKFDQYSDSIVITHLSFETKIILVEEIVNKQVIKLSITSNKLNEITVIADNSYAYTLVKKCKKKLKSRHEVTSKAYLSLETESDNQPLELLQGFYNVTIKNNYIENIKLKAGRIALAPQDGRYFVSLSTTNALTNLDILTPIKSLPINPFQVRNLKKRYTLTLLTDQNSQVQHIAFEPNAKEDQYFTGEMWIDKKSFALKKISLLINDTKRFPFHPIKPFDSLNHIDLKIDITYDERDKLISVIDFSYKFDYISNASKERSIRKISGEGLLYAYNKEETFILPIYDYSEEHNDYRKISFLPYDSTFWVNAEQLTLSKNQIKKLNYFNKQGTVINFYEDIFNEDDTKSTFFEQNNIFWSADKRWSLSTKEINLEKVDLYPTTHIEVQWLIQIDEKKDSLLKIKSYTVLDIFKTKYYLPDLPEHKVYLNIYFDIYEIERQALSLKTEGLTSLNAFNAQLEDSKQQLEQRLKKFKSETDYGNNLDALKKWNDYVKQNLNIDNFAELGLTPDN
jgi:hypothetical protein